MKKLKRVFGSMTNLAGESRKMRRTSSVSNVREIDPNNPRIIIGDDRISGRSSSPAGNLVTYTSYKRSSLDSLDQINNHLLRFPEKLVVDSFFSKLHKAAYEGDIGKLKKNIKKVSVDLPDSSGRTALHLAASRGRREAVNYLLNSGADIDVADEFGSTALLEATKAGHTEIVKLLISKNASVDIRDSEGNTVLHYAALLPSSSSADAILKTVLKKVVHVQEGGLLEASNDIGRTPIHFACLRGNMTVCTHLLESGASVNCSDKEGVTALMLAAQSGNVQVIGCLLNNSADAYMRDSRDYSAADYAKLSGNDYAREMLIGASHSEGQSHEQTQGGFSDDPEKLLPATNRIKDRKTLIPSGLLVDDPSKEDVDSGNVCETIQDEKYSNGKDSDYASTIIKDISLSDDSWGENSDSSDNNKKVNLTKLLPASSSDSENSGASNGVSVSNTNKRPSGPPKPPRLNASNSSSLFSLEDIEASGKSCSENREPQSEIIFASSENVKENQKELRGENSENSKALKEKQSDSSETTSGKKLSQRNDSTSDSFNYQTDSVSIRMNSDKNKFDISADLNDSNHLHGPDISACNKSIDLVGKGSLEQDIESLEYSHSNEVNVMFENDILNDVNFDSSEEISFSENVGENLLPTDETKSVDSKCINKKQVLTDNKVTKDCFEISVAEKVSIENESSKKISFSNHSSKSEKLSEKYNKNCEDFTDHGHTCSLRDDKSCEGENILSARSYNLGTLGRKDTLQEVEEMWEANASVDYEEYRERVEQRSSSPIDYNSNNNTDKRKTVKSPLKMRDLNMFDTVDDESSSVNGVGSLVLSSTPTDLDLTMDENLENLPIDNSSRIEKDEPGEAELPVDSGIEKNDLSKQYRKTDSAFSQKQELTRDLIIKEKESETVNVTENSTSNGCRSQSSSSRNTDDPDGFSSLKKINDNMDGKTIVHQTRNLLQQESLSPKNKIKTNQKSMLAKAKDSFKSVRKDSISIGDLFAPKYRRRSNVALERSNTDIKATREFMFNDKKKFKIQKRFSFDGSPLQHNSIAATKEIISTNNMDEGNGAQKENFEKCTYFGVDAVDISTPRDDLSRSSDAEQSFHFQLTAIDHLMVPLAQLENADDLPESVQYLLRDLRIQMEKQRALNQEIGAQLSLLKQSESELLQQIQKVEKKNSELECRNMKVNATNQLLAYQKNARTEDVVMYESFLFRLNKVCEGLRQQVADLKNKHELKAIRLDVLTVQMETICDINDMLQKQRVKKFITTNNECQVDTEVTDFSCQAELLTISQNTKISEVKENASQTEFPINKSSEEFKANPVDRKNFGTQWSPRQADTSLTSLEKQISPRFLTKSTQVEYVTIADNFYESHTQTTPRYPKSYAAQTDFGVIGYFYESETQTTPRIVQCFASQTEFENESDVTIFCDDDSEATGPHSAVIHSKNSETQTYKMNLPCTASIQTAKAPIKNALSQTGGDWQLAVATQTDEIIYSNKCTQTILGEIFFLCDKFTQPFTNPNQESIGIQCNSESKTFESGVLVKNDLNGPTSLPVEYSSECQGEPFDLFYKKKYSSQHSISVTSPVYKSDSIHKQLNTSLDSIDRHIMHICGNLNPDKIKEFSFSRDSLLKIFDDTTASSPVPNVKREEQSQNSSGCSSKLQSSPFKKQPSSDMTQFSVKRMERILTKLQAVEEDSLNRLLKASEAQHTLANSHLHHQHQQAEDVKECLNVLAADVKVGLFGIKEDLRNCLQDRDKLNIQVVALEDLIQDLKASNALLINDLTNNFLTKYSSGLKELQETIDFCVKELKSSGFTSSADLNKALHELKECISTKIELVGDSIPKRVRLSLSALIENELRKVPQNVSMKIECAMEEDMRRIRYLEKDVKSSLDVLSQQFREIEENNSKFEERLKDRNADLNLLVSEAIGQHFQIKEQQIHEEQTNLISKITELTHLLQKKDDFCQDSDKIVHEISDIKDAAQNTNKERSKVERLIIENESLRNALEEENFKRQELEQRLKSLNSSANATLIVDISSGENCSVSEMETVACKSRNSSVSEEVKQKTIQLFHSEAPLKTTRSPGLSQRETLQEIKDIKAKNMIAEAKLRELEETNFSLDNNMKLSEIILKEEQQRVRKLQSELSSANEMIMKLHQKKSSSHNDILNHQLLVSKVQSLTVDRDEKEYQMNDMNEKIISQESMIKKKENQITQLQRKLNLSIEENTELQIDVQTITSSLMEAEDKIKRGDLLLLQLKKEFEIQRLALQEKEALLTEGDSKLNQLHSDISAKQENHRKLLTLIEDLSLKLDEKQEKIEALTAHLEEMSNQSSLKLTHFEEVKSKLETALKDRNNLLKKNLELQEHIASSDILKQDNDFNQQLLRKSQNDYKELQEKISSSYIPKSSLKFFEQELESKYQLMFNEKLAKLQIASENRQSRETFLKESFAATEENLQKELDSLSEEVVRLRAKLSLRAEKSESWKRRHDHALRRLKTNQEKLALQSIKQNSDDNLKKPKILSEMESNKNEAQMLDLFVIGRKPILTNGNSSFNYHEETRVNLPSEDYGRKRRGPVDLIDSCYHSHALQLDKSLNKVYDDTHGHIGLSNNYNACTSGYSGFQSRNSLLGEGGDRFGYSSIHSTLQDDESNNLDESCEEYVDMLKKRYAL